MHGLRLVTRPATNSSGIANNGRCWRASDNPDGNSARVTTGGIITTLGTLSRTALVAGAAAVCGAHWTAAALSPDSGRDREAPLGPNIFEYDAMIASADA